MQLLDYDGRRAKGINYSKVQLWRKAKEGSFPAPIRLGEGGEGRGRIAWVESEIDDWIAQQIAKRDAERGAA